MRPIAAVIAVLLLVLVAGVATGLIPWLPVPYSTFAVANETNVPIRDVRLVAFHATGSGRRHERLELDILEPGQTERLRVRTPDLYLESLHYTLDGAECVLEEGLLATTGETIVLAVLDARQVDSYYEKMPSVPRQTHSVQRPARAAGEASGRP